MTIRLNLSASREYAVPPKANIFASNFTDFHGNRLTKFEKCALQIYGERKSQRLPLTNLVQCSVLTVFLLIIATVVCIVQLESMHLTRSLHEEEEGKLYFRQMQSYLNYWVSSARRREVAVSP